MIDRKWISQQFMRGVGIEIGAFHHPWPHDSLLSTVHYVDKADAQTILLRHPDLRPDTLCVETQILDDAESLHTIPDESYDFVIASHVLEHCFSPLTAIDNHLRVLKPRGMAIYALPDKRYTFDRKRDNSDCMLNDYFLTEHHPELIEERKVDHHHDYLLHVDQMTDPQERIRLAQLRLSQGQDIHYHAWDSTHIDQLFHLAQITFKNFEVALFYPSGHEVFIVLRKPS